MSDDKDQVYGPERAQRLVAMLRALAERIQALDRTGQLFDRVPELQKLLGNARSELFHYEVRVTYDTPEIAESRRIVEDAEQPTRDAGEQGKFWEMHDQLFTNHQWAQTGKNPRSLFRSFAQAAGLDLDKYDACMDGQRYAGRIQASVQEGEALGVGGTPTFFVNGKRFDGHPTSDAFKSLVDSLTKQTKPRK